MSCVRGSVEKWILQKYWTFTVQPVPTLDRGVRFPAAGHGAGVESGARAPRVRLLLLPLDVLDARRRYADAPHRRRSRLMRVFVFVCVEVEEAEDVPERLRLSLA